MISEIVSLRELRKIDIRLRAKIKNKAGVCHHRLKHRCLRDNGLNLVR